MGIMYVYYLAFAFNPHTYNAVPKSCSEWLFSGSRTLCLYLLSRPKNNWKAWKAGYRFQKLV